MHFIRLSILKIEKQCAISFLVLKVFYFTAVKCASDCFLYFGSYLQRQVVSSQSMFRSGRQELFCKTGVLKTFSKFTGKRLCQSLFFIKVTGLRPAALLKKRLWHSFLSVDLQGLIQVNFDIGAPILGTSNLGNQIQSQLYKKITIYTLKCFSYLF